MTSTTPSTPAGHSKFQFSSSALDFSPIHNRLPGKPLSTVTPQQGPQVSTTLPAATPDIGNLDDAALQQLVSSALSAMQTRGLPPPLVTTVSPDIPQPANQQRSYST